MTVKSHEPNENDMFRLCDMRNIPVATNIATAEVLIHGLERGDLGLAEHCQSGQPVICTGGTGRLPEKDARKCVFFRYKEHFTARPLAQIRIVVPIFKPKETEFTLWN